MNRKEIITYSVSALFLSGISAYLGDSLGSYAAASLDLPALTAELQSDASQGSHTSAKVLLAALQENGAAKQSIPNETESLLYAASTAGLPPAQRLLGQYQLRELKPDGDP
ncbi:hypothetical protein IJT17_09330, partial [bacterium]|nr:hypothetical protein [bacterium]